MKFHIIFIFGVLATLACCQHNAFRDPKEIRNRGHIEEHLRDQMDVDKVKLDDNSMDFHYFKLHDYDANGKLDGLEIIAALSDHHNKDGNEANQDDITQAVDDVLREDDVNNDGYIDYPEYLRVQKRT